MPKPKLLRRVKKRILGERDRVRLVGRHYEHARELLLYTVDLLNQTPINYHVVYGTLLGLARDGDLIPWDIDIDVMIGRGDVEEFRQLFGKYRSRGWRVRDKYPVNYDYAAWNRGDVSSIMFKRPLLRDLAHPPILRTGRKIMDVYVRYPDGDCEAWDTFDMVSRAPKRFFEGYETIEYGGRRVHVPQHHREYLELVYGNWKVRNPDYDAKREDGTLTYHARRAEIAVAPPARRAA